MIKETLLKQTDPKIIIDCIATFWPRFPDEEEEELCIEAIYDIIAHSAALPENYNMLSDEEKSQFEIDIDMELITINFKDIEKYIFKEEHNKVYFWGKVSKTEKSEAIFQKIF